MSWRERVVRTVAAVGVLASAGCAIPEKTFLRHLRLENVIVRPEEFVGEKVVVVGFLASQPQSGRAPDVCTSDKPHYYSDKLQTSDYPSAASFEIVHCEPSAYKTDPGEKRLVEAIGQIYPDRDPRTTTIVGYYFRADSYRVIS